MLRIIPERSRLHGKSRDCRKNTQGRRFDGRWRHSTFEPFEERAMLSVAQDLQNEIAPSQTALNLMSIEPNARLSRSSPGRIRTSRRMSGSKRRTNSTAAPSSPARIRSTKQPRPTAHRDFAGFALRTWRY